MKIEERAIDSIAPYKNNARRRRSESVDAIAASIERFGFKQPIVIDENGAVVCGEGRLLAAKKLELPTVPCVIASDLTPDEIKAYRLLDNKTRDLSAWDADALRTELDSLDLDFGAFAVDFSEDLAPNLDAKEEKSDAEKNDAPPTAFKIVVSLDDEEEQRELYETLVAQGYDARLCNL